MFKQTIPARLKRLQTKVDDLQADVEARDRRIRVLEAELETMAAVIARDRERIKAEGAAYARSRAEAETKQER